MRTPTLTAVSCNMGSRSAEPLLGPVTLAIDHVKAMRSCIPGEVTSRELGVIKQELAAACNVSVLTDPEHGLETVRSSLAPHQKLVVSIEDGDHAAPELAPRVLKGWDAAKIADSGAKAIKCFFWYEPGPEGKQARDFLANVARQCAAAKIPLIAEPILVEVTNGESEQGHSERLLDTVRELNDFGAAALKLEFPGGRQASPEHGTDISGQITELSAVPWYLLSQGVSFEVFQQQLAASMAGGASGCLVGRAVWGDLISSRGVEEPAQQTLRDRLSILEGIAARNLSARVKPQLAASENEA